MENTTCPTQPATDCQAANCRWRCALDVIDELLGRRSTVSGEEVDHLLDLRWQLRQQANAEHALRLFCDLRLRMEKRHYLAFFRIRRWLENHVVAAVQLCPAAEAHLIPVKLDRFCVEAIRRSAICETMRAGKILLAPRVHFEFRHLGNAPLEKSVASLALDA